MENLTYTQIAWIDNLVNREGFTRNEATQKIISISNKLNTDFISYGDIENEIYK